MAWIGNQVVLYKECELRVPDGNGGYIYQKFREDELHRPLILTSAQYPHLNISTSNLIGYYNNPQPRKGRLLSEIEVNIDYELFTGLTSQRTTPKFMCLTGSGDTQLMEIYGWIDRAEPIATKGPKTNTLIHWHVDYWFTLQMMEWNANKYPAQWSSKGFAFGRGTFKRGPAGMARPDPSAPRMWLYDSDTVLRDYSTTLAKRYAIILWTETFTDPNDQSVSITGICSGYWALGETYTSNGTTYQAPGIRDIYGGILEEMLGLPASSIIGVWFSPIAYGDGTSTIKTNDYKRPYSSATYHSFMHTYGYLTPSSTTPVTVTISNTAVCTSDTVKYLVTDPKGTVYATLPWGIQFTACRMTLDVGTTGAWLVLRFLEDPNANMPLQEGREVQIPLIAAPVTSNAMSDYVSSGQQDYDRQSAILQQEYNRKSGVANAMQSAGSGAIGGALVGKAPGAIAGALIGGGMGILQTQINYQLGTEFDRKSQQLLDQLTSNQIGSVLTRSGGPMWYQSAHGGGYWRLVKMVRDPLSMGELETEQAERGCVCDTYTTNCTTVIQSGGPMRIEGLEVKGDLSKEARTYIQQMFDRGVHLDLIY